LIRKPSGILFDMDGVLVDVRESYHQTIIQTVKYFTSGNVNSSDIQSLKEKGGYNNDWKLTYKLIQLNGGQNVSLKKVIEKFQSIYLGYNFSGLINNEVWLFNKELLHELAKEYPLGIVTGRPTKDAIFSLKNENVLEYFHPVIAMEHVQRPKPDPSGIILALKQLNIEDGWYLGDTVDDIQAALISNVTPIGVMPPGANELKRNYLLKCGATKVLNNVNEIISLI